MLWSSIGTILFRLQTLFNCLSIFCVKIKLPKALVRRHRLNSVYVCLLILTFLYIFGTSLALIPHKISFVKFNNKKYFFGIFCNFKNQEKSYQGFRYLLFLGCYLS